MPNLRVAIFSLLISVCAALCKTPRSVSGDAGFVDIFNRQSLDQWEGDPTYWRVENGVLVGEVTPATLLKQNSFIIWRGGVVKDFELKVEVRISDKGNSGINYRSEEVPGQRYVLRGYQSDLDGGLMYIGSNYEERRRTTLASIGSKVVLDPVDDSSVTAETATLTKYIRDNRWAKAQIIGSLGDPDSLRRAFKKNDWNEYHLVAKGNHLQHYINGVLMSDVTDNDTLNRRMEGLLGVQVHVGPPMKVEYRRIRLKTLGK